MTFEITPEQIESITDEEHQFGTVRLLPDWASIPDEFKRGNSYTKIADNLFSRREHPVFEIVLKPGITPDAMNRCLLAHIASWEPKHQHKIAGIGYMIFCASIPAPAI